MRYILTLLTVLVISVQPAAAQDGAITFDGEQFTKKFIGSPPDGDKLVEFIRENETFDNWTKLLAFRYQQLPTAGNEPKKVAAEVFQRVKASNSKALANVMISEQKSEAIIDFLTWPKDEKYIEFNVFRYAKSADGKAVVSLQFAYRMTDTKGLKVVKELRSSWINKVAEFNMNHVRASLANRGEQGVTPDAAK